MSENGRNPYYRLLNTFRSEADSRIPLYFCLGEILAITETTLRIRADGHELDEQDVMINDMLRVNFEEEAEITMSEDLEMSGTLYGAASPCPNGGHSYFQVNSIDNGYLYDETAKYKVKYRLKKGDIVLLIPDQDRQMYYLVMKVVSHGPISSDQSS